MDQGIYTICPSYKQEYLCHMHTPTTSHTNTHTHTHTHSNKQDLLSYQLILGTCEGSISAGVSWAAQTRTRIRVSNRNLRLVIHLVLLLQKVRVCYLLDRLWIGSTFYRIRLLAEYVFIKQWLITGSRWAKCNLLTSWLAAEHFGILCFLYNPCVISFTLKRSV